MMEKRTDQQSLETLVEDITLGLEKALPNLYIKRGAKTAREIGATQQRLTSKLGVPYYFDAGKEILFWELAQYHTRSYRKKSDIRILDFIGDGYDSNILVPALEEILKRRLKDNFSYDNSAYTREEKSLIEETDLLYLKVEKEYQEIIAPISKVLNQCCAGVTTFNIYYKVLPGIDPPYESRVITADLPTMGYATDDILFRFFIQVRKYADNHYEEWYSIAKYKHSDELGYPMYQSMEEIRPFKSVKDSVSGYLLGGLMNDDIELSGGDRDLLDKILENLI